MAMFLWVKMRAYIFVSRGEGSTGPGLQSDRDILFQSTTAKVVTDLSQCQPEIINFLMVKDDHTHPGYVKLQLICILPDNTQIPMYLERYNDDFTTVDSLNRYVLLNTMHHNSGIISGPALHIHSCLKQFSYDHVFALRCSQWPQEGNEWFQRHRFYGWPTPIQIENALEYGCFATPVGHTHRSECHLEHRLSFSNAERNIIRSFEDTTMKVYILLKMIRKTYLEPVVGEAFSSYHCKVCMFWMRDKTPLELWKNENLLQCLVLCIRQLYEWATTGFCPDYFIVKNNIYDRKITGAVRHNLVQILRNLLSSNCTFLLGIKCYNLGRHMAVGMSRYDHCSIMITFEESCDHKMIFRAADDCRYRILQNIPQHYSTLVDYLGRITYASKYVPYIMQYPLTHVKMIIWSQLGFRIATICKENAHFLSQDQVDYLMALASGCLSFGINSDTTSVRLKLCGLGMELGNHNLIETFLQYISDYHMRYAFSNSIADDVVPTFIVGSCREMWRGKIYNTVELLQTLTSCSVVYLPPEMSITTKPLTEMFRSIGAPSELRQELIDYWFEWGVVDSRTCLYFFQYLNFSRQRKQRQKQVAIDNMIHVIRTKPHIPHRHTAFNLLGYSFMQEKQLTDAYRCFYKSLTICPYYNAAKFYLGIMFNRIHATDRGHTHHVNRRSDISS